MGTGAPCIPVGAAGLILLLSGAAVLIGLVPGPCKQLHLDFAAGLNQLLRYGRPWPSIVMYNVKVIM